MPTGGMSFFSQCREIFMQRKVFAKFVTIFPTEISLHTEIEQSLPCENRHLNKLLKCSLRNIPLYGFCGAHQEAPHGVPFTRLEALFIAWGDFLVISFVSSPNRFLVLIEFKGFGKKLIIKSDN
jgi:hypothetical protein